MTIAACHVSPEGVVLGTDSTSTITAIGQNGQTRRHYLDHEQKLFEVGPRGETTIGLATWGLGRIGATSHRTIAANLAKMHADQPFPSIEEAARRLGEIVWGHLENAFENRLTDALSLYERYVAKETLSADDWALLKTMDDSIPGGYFIGGRIEEGEECSAFEVKWSVRHRGPEVIQLPPESPNFRGQASMMERLVFGHDEGLMNRILDSGKWNGTVDELIEVLFRGHLIQPEYLPLREAIDWIHTVIHTTIRAVKFSGWHHCGGAVELATITTDRPFRWVCHKPLGSAIVSSHEQGRSDA